MAIRTSYPNLFKPGHIGLMEIKNRIVMSPMATNFADEKGNVTELMIHHYEQRAKGGVGLIIVEGTCIDYPRGKHWINELSIDDDRYIPGFKHLVDAIHKHGAKIAIQLHHSGRSARQRITGQQPVGPSDIPAPGGEEPRALAVADIKELVHRYADAAMRARESGFDGVEIHSAHGYLLADFLSQASNNRKDEYGGTLDRRSRFLLEVIEEIKNSIGSVYPVWCRLNGEQRGITRGLTIDEVKIIAKMAQEAGADALSISVYGYGEEAPVLFPEQAGALIPLAESVKHAVSIPVITIGAMNPDVGEEVLAGGKADFIAMGRELLCDPELPLKVTDGRLDDIVPCIHCLNCIDKLLAKAKKIDCAVNATLGRDVESRPVLTGKRRSVLVIGGGPAGMEAARVAALRGHDVTLYERNKRLGGQMSLASLPPHKNRIEDYINYLTNQVNRLGVKVEVGEQVTPEMIQKIRPDVIVVATGITSSVPQIPGLSKMRPVFAHDVLSGRNEIGEQVIIIGGGVVGAETADFISEMGKKVTIVEVLPQIASTMPALRRVQLLSRLKSKDVKILTNSRCEEVSPEGIAINTDNGQRHTIKADTIVIAVGGGSNNALYQAVQGKIPRTFLVGDALEPRTIVEAVAEGYDAGFAI